MAQSSMALVDMLSHRAVYTCPTWKPKKRKKECSARGRKRKLLNDEIDELQKKKRCLQTDNLSWWICWKGWTDPPGVRDYLSLIVSEDQRRSRVQKWLMLKNSWSRSRRSSRATNEVVLDSLLWNICCVNTPLILSNCQHYYKQLQLSLIILS